MREDRERALAKRYVTNMEKLSAGTKALPKLAVGDNVIVQNQLGNHPSKWHITGVVVEVKDHDQYIVKIDGSGRMTLRNRKFLKKINPFVRPKTQIDPVKPSVTGDRKEETSSTQPVSYTHLTLPTILLV